MSITARTANRDDDPTECTGCDGTKGAPLATRVDIGGYATIVLCEECGRDLANAVGFMCVREGGWSRIEPKKRSAKR